MKRLSLRNPRVHFAVGYSDCDSIPATSLCIYASLVDVVLIRRPEPKASSLPAILSRTRSLTTPPHPRRRCRCRGCFRVPRRSLRVLSVTYRVL